MTRLHRTSCPGLRTLVVAGLAVAALVVPAQAATASAPTVPHGVPFSGVLLPGTVPDFVTPPVPGRGPHDFGWQ
ncbi:MULTISPECIES: hypothetical protein [unclassified Streptomyces]|uniref:hypothetical protein n=1 Tax=unclassified Streptomyces TaxID=2593676 RepID=UPI00093C4D45|nr:hypothetical protein [Streptomyces sp. CB02058]OKI94621.1 hypothetical protein AMK10_20330 [Streptomyces sp. CB02058]